MADQSPSTHPVAGNGAADAAAALQDFDGISYAKGAAVLRQLAAYVGDEVFLGGLRAYFDALRASATPTFADLISCWTEAGAPDLDALGRGLAADHRHGHASTSPVGRPQIAIEVTPAASGPAGPPARHRGRGGQPRRTGAGHGAGGRRPPDRRPLEVPAGTVLVVPDAARRDLGEDPVRPRRLAGGGRGAARHHRRVRRWSCVYNAIRDAVRDADAGPRARAGADLRQRGRHGLGRDLRRL